MSINREASCKATGLPCRHTGGGRAPTQQPAHRARHLPWLGLLRALDRRVRVAGPRGDAAVDVGHRAAGLRWRRVGQLDDGRAAGQVQNVRQPCAVRSDKHLLRATGVEGWGDG